MAKLIVEVSDRLHRELKHKAVLRNLTIKEIVTRLVEDYLRRDEEGSAELTEGTGICGAWTDARSADEIIADIRAQRRWFETRRRRTHA